MTDAIQSFLKTSTADRVKVQPNVVIHRTELSPMGIVRIRRDNNYTIPESESLCELEAGGQVIADGKIVKRKGAYYFKVSRIF